MVYYCESCNQLEGPTEEKDGELVCGICGEEIRKIGEDDGDR